MGLLDGKVAIVTGSGHGIGRGHAMEMARLGAKVVVNDLGGSERGEGSGKAADDTVALIEAAGGDGVAQLRQRGRPRAVRRARSSRRSTPTASSTSWSTTPASSATRRSGTCRSTTGTRSWPSTCGAPGRRRTSRRSTSATGPSRAATLHGRIINTTSGAGLGGNFGQSGYATAKAAIVGITLTVAQELYRSGVTVNCIGPAGLTRITATMPGSGDAFEPDEVPEGEWNPHGPEEQLAGRGVAGERRGRLRHRPGHPRDPRQAHLDGRVVRAQGRSAARASRGTPRSSACSWPPRSSRPATAAWSSAPSRTRSPSWRCPPTSRSSTA